MPRIFGTISYEKLENGTSLVALWNGADSKPIITQNFIDNLSEVCQEIKNDPPLLGVIFVSADPNNFIFGADINIIASITNKEQGEALSREGQIIFNKISSLPVPTAAIINGACIGGGCEMVLACDYRIMIDSTNGLIGLPETKLGIIPGFGGTQRLPRIIGLIKALNIILNGKNLRPKEALKIGLIDKLVNNQKEGLKLAEEILRVKPKTNAQKQHLTNLPLIRDIIISSARKKVRNLPYPALNMAINAVAYGLAQGLSNGLKKEAELLGESIITPERSALTHLYFAGERSKAFGKKAKNEIDKLTPIAVIGGGVMGSGIATALLKSGFKVVLVEKFESPRKLAHQRIVENIWNSSSLSTIEKKSIIDNLCFTSSLSNYLEGEQSTPPSIVIEAIFEDFALKAATLAELSQLLRSDAIIASNTSSLSISALAEQCQFPERVIGMHFFNPVHKMPLIEVVSATQSADRAIAIVTALTIAIGKTPIVVNDSPGFLVNRILAPYLAEASALLAEGYSIEAIDGAARWFGMPMGPFRLLDEVGLDIAASVSEILKSAYGDRMKATPFAKTLASYNFKGKKTGLGFYDHSGKQAKVRWDIKDVLALTNYGAAHASKETLAERLILPMINEALIALHDGVAGHPSNEAATQIDLASVMGFGFPPFRGGIIYFANSLGLDNVHDNLKRLQSSTNGSARFIPSRYFEAAAQI
ncbi:MAG TPA: 3-hydroxyacyl-CoA dehydrogenase NAD-binding domain-containing protein [Oligoflexia bacterium]|nr:3-hydroxyacyl-CoA dehydrogenase NAD-binding domain-containing protein [Oligoflexia bacterium]HMP26432.1 3-hydroxyacyl-CoA dehydrogenase NAD-binding domain-containing protein [Oligoflexia bacterium]